ncbi:hypothetical protein Droror1_Dr00014894 [Drosera rotundifolia]
MKLVGERGRDKDFSDAVGSEGRTAARSATKGERRYGGGGEEDVDCCKGHGTAVVVEGRRRSIANKGNGTAAEERRK